MTEAGTIGFCTEEQFMDYFIIEEQTPKDLLRKYTNNLTGTSLCHQSGHLASGWAGTLIKAGKSSMKRLKRPKAKTFLSTTSI